MKINDITIKVHRFGPLEDVSFKIAPMMIFTGMSSLGKSYANYLVYYFLLNVCNGYLRDFLKANIDFGKERQQLVFDIDVFFSQLSAHVETFMQKFLGDDGLKADVEFRSLKKKRTCQIEFWKDEPANEEEATFQHTVLQAYWMRFEGGAPLRLPSKEYILFYAERDIELFVLGQYLSRAVILPPGRGAFVGENFSLKSEVGSSMDMYNNFFRDYDYGLNQRIRLRGGVSEKVSDHLLQMTSGGKLLSIEGKQYLQLDDEHRIALSAGASSVKDLSPWLFYMQNHWNIFASFCLEEPEAHQHPSVTLQIADVIAVLLNQGNIFHLTTHSDYLIQRLNQLVKLGGVRRKDKTLFAQICKERSLNTRSYLDASDIRAYYFSKNSKGKTVVEALKVTDDGIPMNTFFDVVRDLEEREDYINAAVYQQKKLEE